MIYLIHGTNQVDSRRFLVKLKNSYQDVQTISGKSLSKESFEEKLKTASYNLFGGKSASLVEHFSGNWDVFPKKLPEGIDIILWSGDKVEVGKIPVKSFLFDQKRVATNFRLADAILFKNEKEAQSLAWELFNSREPAEKITGAILRSLLLAFCAKENQEEIPIPPFAKAKVTDQAKIWSRSALKRAILKLLQTDLSIKEGKDAPLAFSQLISQLVSS